MRAPKLEPTTESKGDTTGDFEWTDECQDLLEWVCEIMDAVVANVVRAAVLQ